MAVNYSNYPASRSANEKQIRLGQELQGLEMYMQRSASQNGEDSATYKKWKKAFDAKQIEYQAAVEEYKSIKAEIDAAENKKTADKQSKKIAEETTSKIKTLEAKRDAAKRRNDTTTAREYQSQITALKAERTAATNPTETETPTGEDTPTTLDQDKYSEYTYLDGKVTNKEGREVIFVDVVNANGTVTQKEYTTRASAREAFLAQYKQSGQIEKLKQDLLAANYIKQKQIVDGSWVDELDRVLIDRTKNVVREVKYGSGKAFSVDEFIKSGKYEDGTKKPIVYTSQSTRGDARTQIDNYLTDLRGTPATDEEYESYYNLLRAEELKQTAISKDGATIGDVMTDAERVLIAAKVARNSLRSMNVDSILASGKGSQLAMDISVLQETAADYGVEMSAGEALKRVTNGIGQKDYLAKQQENIRQLAVTLHPYLKEHILAGGKVSDVANQYASIEYKKLGKPVETPTKSKRIMSAISRGVSLDQFDRELQNSDEWAFSDEAHSVADNFLSNLGRMWGRR